MLPHLLLLAALFCQSLAIIYQPRREPKSFPGLPTILKMSKILQEDSNFGISSKLLNSYGTSATEEKELAAAGGYEATNVEVLTEDGYSLWMHRIGNNHGPPVLMQHGIFVASESWMLQGPNNGLVFLLLREGFDVWLANHRGTVYNDYSLKYKRSDPRFWNFSFHEIGYYDNPAFIDAILNIRQVDQLFYIGHSLGTTVFLVMASERPEYNSKIRVAALLSPVAFAPSIEEQAHVLRIFSKNSETIYKGMSLIGNYEIAFRSMASIKSLNELCNQYSPTQPLCLDLLALMAGEHRSNLNKKDYGAFMTYYGAGTSLKTLYHAAQIYRSGEFRQFDYDDRQQNRIRYNSTEPPIYNLNLVTAPVALFWGHNDPLISKNSVERLASMLPNLIFSKAVTDTMFSHIDMLLGLNAYRVLYHDIIHLFQSFFS